MSKTIQPTQNSDATDASEGERGLNDRQCQGHEHDSSFSKGNKTIIVIITSTMTLMT